MNKYNDDKKNTYQLVILEKKNSWSFTAGPSSSEIVGRRNLYRGKPNIIIQKTHTDNLSLLSVKLERIFIWRKELAS